MFKDALCGDIGGTHANLCIAQYNERIVITEKTQKQTSDYSDFSNLINHYLESVTQKPKAACFAAAGPKKNQRIEMTNAKLVIDANEIKKNTPLEKVLVINDFDAIGYAINVLEPNETKIINKGTSKQEAMRAAIGAGTGLGKSVLIFDQKHQAYLPHSSEGGHTNLPLYHPDECELFSDTPHPSYEDLLSGRGLKRIYTILNQTKYPKEKSNLSSKEISESRNTSPCSKETFKWFVKFYARCARNFAIDLLAKGGIYLAGGIAAANHDQFGEAFMEEFTSHPLPQFRNMLEQIPVTLITDYGISLKGAAFALQVQD